MWHAQGRKDMHTGVCWQDVKARECLEDIGIDERLTLKWIIKKWDMRMWNVFS
jgi:hypothetical protein